MNAIIIAVTFFTQMYLRLSPALPTASIKATKKIKWCIFRIFS